jgi:hypothetical protein
MEQMQFIANLIFSFVFLLFWGLWIAWSAQSKVLTFFREFFQQSVQLFIIHVFTTHFSVFSSSESFGVVSVSQEAVFSSCCLQSMTECPSTKNLLQKICNSCGKISLKYTFVKTAPTGHSGSDGSKIENCYVFLLRVFKWCWWLLDLLRSLSCTSPLLPSQQPFSSTTWFTSTQLQATSSPHPNPCPFQVSYACAEGWFCPSAANP